MTKTATELMLPGQSAAPPGPVDVSGMYVMHHAFRRDLRAFENAVATTPASRRTAWRALRSRWYLFSRLLHLHHSGEDAGLWPLLRERVDAADDAAGRAVLEAMEAEHAQIDPVLTACADGFARLADHADDDARAALEIRVVSACQMLGRHLAHEESEAMALVQKYLTQADWHRMEKESIEPEYGPRDMVAGVPWLLHELPVQARRQVLAQPGGRLLRVIWALTWPAFVWRERAAFGR